MTEPSPIPTVNFQDVKNVPGTNNYLIDVRERDELRETGQIPGSINIPLGEIEKALTTLPEDAFEKKYNKKKPEKVTEIIFSCRSGKRSDMAAQLAKKLGYENVYNYSGGWLDWENQTQEEKK